MAPTLLTISAAVKRTWEKNFRGCFIGKIPLSAFLAANLNPTTCWLARHCVGVMGTEETFLPVP
jgi:hypothetical protein